MSGCAVSYDPSTSSKSTPVDFPPLGQVNTAYVGDSMMSKGILFEGEAIVLKNAIDREFNFEVQFPIKNQAAFRSSSKTT
ncbi:hypothetical protein, partial [Aeromonas veronii]|uniref:hypothetical protein n=1 Tax=Aeromonas veronii TaxID=654 RepID=UPI00195511F5